ncbi:ABC transporter permease subunit [Paenibacillus sp. LMG 31460]|uniref:ABC transporter permease subunit n=1 Tax=Paenibacillus germinis TaxID=2654979 RepID=A0ABX1Z5T6_9BACL|nr:sugar ABC transporter permease [Paenibacillus germinis]NOU87606.1 ABC transporter permease subunit [Paenibacillus germinis]
MNRTASSKWRRTDNLSAYMMMTPGFVLYVVFVFLPMMWVLYISFTSYDGAGTPRWVGIDNFAYALKDRVWWNAVWNTFIFALFKILIEAPLALILAVILNKKVFAANWFRTIFFLPHLVSMAVMGVIFYFLLRPVDGVINGVLQMLHVIGAPVDYLGSPFWSMTSLILIGIWSGFGVNMIYFLIGLQTIPKELYECADLEGASESRKLISITIPMLGPIFSIVVMMMIVYTLKTFDIVKVLTDGGPYGKTEIMFTYIYRYFFSDSTTSQQQGYGSALSIMATVIIGVISILYFRMQRKTQHQE